MASTKTTNTVVSSQTCAAAATVTSSAVDISTAYDVVVTAQITNGATGPTLPCAGTITVRSDGSTFNNYSIATANTTNSGVSTFAWELPLGAGDQFKVAFTGNTAQTVTVASQACIATGI